MNPYVERMECPLLVFSSPYTFLHAPTSLQGYESCRGEQKHRTLKLEVWSPRWLLGARGRIKEERKFSQSCFKSSEVKYSFGQ